MGVGKFDLDYEISPSGKTKLSEVSSSTAKQKQIDSVFSGDFISDLSRATKYSPEYLTARSNTRSAFDRIAVASADQKLQVVANANAGQTIKDGSGLASSKQSGASANLSIKKFPDTVLGTLFMNVYG